MHTTRQAGGIGGSGRGILPDFAIIRHLDRAAERVRRMWLKRRDRGTIATKGHTLIEIDGLHYTLRAAYEYDRRVIRTHRLPGAAERTLCTSVLTPGAVVVDVGAHWGALAIPLAEAVKPHGQVFAFEPNPEIAHLLRHHAKINKSPMTILTWALSDQVTTLTLYQAASGDQASNTCLPTSPVATEHVACTDVQVTTLNAWASIALTRLDVLKIDVEGMESRVLTGGMNTILKYRPHMLIEVNRLALQGDQCTPARLLQQIADLGYRLYKPVWRRLLPVDPRQDYGALYDVWCVPQD